ncbi:uncharacterized protein [Narcine bancroftii]|uniref:uncharacterized protein isoform X5 n=1 Tax=Narcine bancroftii TaxID=1343680 RepID=UPI003831922E
MLRRKWSCPGHSGRLSGTPSSSILVVEGCPLITGGSESHKQKKKNAMCSRPSWTNATKQRTQSSGDEYNAEYYWMERHEGHARIRKATTGTVLPKWMMTPGSVLLWKHCRPHKAVPLVDQMELRHVNPQYAFVTFPDGREDSVATKDLTPARCVNNVEETQMSMNQQGAQQKSLEQLFIESSQSTIPPTPEISPWICPPHKMSPP